ARDAVDRVGRRPLLQQEALREREADPLHGLRADLGDERGERDRDGTHRVAGVAAEAHALLVRDAVGPVVPGRDDQSDRARVHVVIFWPVPLRARSFTIAIASSSVGTIFSMPTTAMCTGGTLVARSALPSFVTSRRVPVSAMSAFPPVIPMSALRKYCRSSALATATSDAVSSGTGWPTTLAKSCATSSRVLW